jgi:hypothetical protein
MSETQDQTSRKRFLLTNLGILSVFILTLLVLLAAYPTLLAPPPFPTLTPTLTPTETSTPTQTPTITLTPTPSRTPRPTFTPTITLTPSETPIPSQTPTPTGPPTLTPARPVVDDESYELAEWSPEQAQRVIELMEDYPNSLTRRERGENDENYYAAFSYAAEALSEAILQFPDAPQAKAWRWKLAYNLARTGNPDAGQHYAALIAEALNTGEANLEGLVAWFQSQEPRLALQLEKLDPVPDALNAYLVRILGQGSGQPRRNAHLLFLETPGAFQPYVLSADFDFTFKPGSISKPASELAGAPEIASLESDLTGDGVVEIGVFHSNPGEDFLLKQPRVFSVAQSPPEELPFNPAIPPLDLGMDYINRWSAVRGPGGVNSLQFQATLFPACPVQVRRVYEWTGTWFDLTREEFTVDPNPATLSFCRLIAEHAANLWGPAAAIPIMETVLPDWPPELAEDGKPFPADAKDEWRYRLGVYHALEGDYSGAIDYFNGIIASPSAPNSRWVILAQQFLDIYQNPEDLYKSCVQAEFCDSGHALRRIVASLPPVAYPQVLTFLWERGVSQRASGYFDFDGDETSEVWFTVRHHPGERLELWILVPTRDRIEAVFVENVDSDKPGLAYYDPEQAPPPVVLVDGTIAFTIQRQPDTLQPILAFPELPKEYPNRFREALQAATGALFSGEDPQVVRDELLALKETPGLLCRGTWSCDPYYYLIGLASELSRDEQGAIDAYLRLWWDYSRSPYTTIARLKLKGGAVLPSATPTPTITGTGIVTLTQTVTGTPPTATPSPTGSQTPGIGQTLTVTITPTSGTPYP